MIKKKLTLPTAANDPERLAFACLRRWPVIRYWRGDFYRWHYPCYAQVPEDELRAECHKRLELEFRKHALRQLQNAPDSEKVTKLKVTRNLKSDVLDAIRAATIVPSSLAIPCWLTDAEGDARDWLVTQSGLLDIRSRELRPATADYFAVNSLPYDYDSAAACPQWLQFLAALWPDDRQSIETLQEVLGYLLTSRTDLQKMFFLIGPKRSGKGTIARVIRELLGPSNVAGPTLSSLADQFGLQPLLNKRLAVVGDARLGGRADASVITERLLSITGEDLQTVHRKHQTAVTDRLPVRFLLISNELPKLDDASATLPSRMILLRLRESFYGREDHTLTERLLAELPGILNWALDGLERLQARKRFIQPETSQDLLDAMEALASPITAFINECCIVAPDRSVPINTLYGRFKSWCEEHGRRPETEQVFGRNIRAALPTLECQQKRSCGTRQRIYIGLDLI